MRGALHMGLRIGERPGDGESRIVGGAGRETVARLREFERDHRPALRHPQKMPEMVAPRDRLAHARHDLYAPGFQDRMAFSGDARVGVLHCGHDARDAGGDDGFCAGRRLAAMRAGLQRRIERRAARRRACGAQRLRLGMWPPARSRHASRDEHAVLDK